MPLPMHGGRSAAPSDVYGRPAASRDPLVDEFFFAPGRGRSVVVNAHAPMRGRSGRPGRGSSSRTRLLAALLAAVVVVAAAAFFVMRSGGSADAMVFKYAFNKGAKQTYALSLSVNVVPAGIPDAQSFEGKVDATLGYEVVETLEDGSSVVDLTLEGLSVTPNPGGFTPGGVEKLTVTIGPDGTVKKVEGSGGIFGAAASALGPSSSPMEADPSDTTGSQALFPQFPANAIAPGDTWEEDTTFPLPFGQNNVTVHTSGKHNGFEEGEFGRVAKMHQSMSTPFDFSFSLAEALGAAGQPGSVPSDVQNAVFKITGDITMDSDSLVIPETGDLVRMDGNGKVSMRMRMEGVPQQPGTPTDFAMEMTMNVSLIRVAGGAAAPADPAAA